MKDIFLSYARSSDRFAAEFRRVIRGIEAGVIRNIHEEQNALAEKKGWQQANEQIRDAIVIILLSDEWFQHKIWELQLALHHRRQFIVVQCHPNITIPRTLPEHLAAVLNQPNWVSLFNADGTVDFDQRDELLGKIRAYVDTNARPSVARDFHRSSRIGTLLKRVEWLENLWNRGLVRVAAVGTMAVVAIVAFGYQLKLETLFPFLVTPVPSPLPTATPVLPSQVSYPLNVNECLAYFEGSDPRWVVSLLCGDSSGSPTPTQLTREGYDSSYPAWSCDGELLAYTSNDNSDKNFDINIYNIEDASRRRIETKAITEANAVFSPDGRQLAYVAKLTGEDDFEIFILDMESEKARRLTDNNVDDLVPDWSCATGLLVFESGVGDAVGGIDLYVNDPVQHYSNGTGDNLTQHTSWRTRFPAWSCDGRQLAYHASPDRNADAEIFIMDADGTNTKQITNDDVNQFGPTWSSDGTRLAFHSNATTSGTNDIFILDIVSRTVTARLTEGLSVNNRSPVWQPNGSC